MKVRLVIDLDIEDLTPREVREAFADANRLAIARAHVDGIIEREVADELVRVLPAPNAA